MEVKKAQSQIITAVLLILIVLSLSLIIFSFVIPFVKESLAGTGCIDVVNQVTFTNSPKYTCFNDFGTPTISDDTILLQVHIGDINQTLNGFLIEFGSATTSAVEITNGNTDIDGVRMFEDTLDSDPLILPGRNEERTYVIDGTIPDTIRIYPKLIDGNVCDFTDEIERLEICA